MSRSTCVLVRAPLIPDVALVELPPKKPSGGVSVTRDCGIDDNGCDAREFALTLLVENDDIPTGQIDGMGSAQPRHCDTSRLAPGSVDTDTDIDADDVMACDREPDPELGPGDGFDLQPPPTTITLGAIVDEVNSRYADAERTRKKGEGVDRRKGRLKSGLVVV